MFSLSIPRFYSTLNIVSGKFTYIYSVPYIDRKSIMCIARSCVGRIPYFADVKNLKRDLRGDK